MEFDLIPQIIIIFSIGTIIFILGRNIPKIKDMGDSDLLFENENKEEKKKFSYLYDRLIKRVKRNNHQKKVNLAWELLEKSLRKIRIKFLKLDNKIVPILEKLKKKNTEYDNSNGEPEIKEEANTGYRDSNSENNAVDDVKPEKKVELEDERIIPENLFLKEPIQKDENEKNDYRFSDLNNTADEFENESEINKVTNEEKEAKTSKEKEYISLILKNPTDIKAYWKLGIVYSRRKKYKDSISCFRQIIKIDPGYTKAKKKIIDLMKRMKKNKKDSK